MCTEKYLQVKEKRIHDIAQWIDDQESNGKEDNSQSLDLLRKKFSWAQIFVRDDIPALVTNDFISRLGHLERTSFDIITFRDQKARRSALNRATIGGSLSWLNFPGTLGASRRMARIVPEEKRKFSMYIKYLWHHLYCGMHNYDILPLNDNVALMASEDRAQAIMYLFDICQHLDFSKKMISNILGTVIDYGGGEMRYIVAKFRPHMSAPPSRSTSDYDGFLWAEYFMHWSHTMPEAASKDYVQEIIIAGAKSLVLAGFQLSTSLRSSLISRIIR